MIFLKNSILNQQKLSLSSMLEKELYEKKIIFRCERNNSSISKNAKVILL